jgi:ADP-heptose:LPS heptosyltransferase
VDEVRTLAYPGFTRRHNANVFQPYALLLLEAARIRREHYELAVVFRPDHWWGALLALLAGVPVRVGGATPETAPLLTHTYSPACSEHAADQALELARLALEAVGVTPVAPDNAPQFRVSDAAREEADEFWRRHGLAGRRVVAIHPNAGAPLKSWPSENWSSLANALLAQDLGVVLVGGPEDRPLLSGVVARAQAAVVACGQSLSVSAALYQHCAVAITVDSGAGHLAAAVGAPTVRLYGPAPPSIFGPWPHRERDHVLLTDRLKCAPCGHLESPPCGAHVQPACMLALSVEDVLNTVQAELSRS